MVHQAVLMHYYEAFMMVMTLIDDKVLNAITETKSNQKCPICHAYLNDFNNLSNTKSSKFYPFLDALQYGAA